MTPETVDERYISRGRERLLLQTYTSSIDGFRINIPLVVSDGFIHGFVTDGGTIPRFAWSIIDHPFGEFFFCYLNHDYMWAFTNLFPQLTFSDTNDILHQHLLHYGASKAKAWAVYRAVQSGGKGIWSKGRHLVGDISWHYAPLHDWRLLTE